MDDDDAQALPVKLSSGENGNSGIELIEKGAVPKEYRGKFKPLRSLVTSDKQCFSWKEVSICSEEFKPYLDVKSAYAKVKNEGLCEASPPPAPPADKEPGMLGLTGLVPDRDDGRVFALTRSLKEAGELLGGKCSEENMIEDLKSIAEGGGFLPPTLSFCKDFEKTRSAQVSGLGLAFVFFLLTLFCFCRATAFVRRVW